MTYTVRAGDSIWSIARRFGLSVRELLAANPQVPASGQIFVGQQLQIPDAEQPPGTFEYIVVPGDTFYRIAQRFRISVEALAAANPQVENPAATRPGQILYIPRRPTQRYVVQQGDTAYQIARKFGVTEAQLRAANAGVNLTRLQVGQQLSIPAAEQRAIVIPLEDYGYDEMMSDLSRLAERYPFIDLSIIGETVLGRPIPAVRIGAGAKEVHYNGSFHAQEWITTPLLMKFIEQYAEAFRIGGRIGEFDIPRLYRETSLWVVPMVNPDGVELLQEGIEPSNPYYESVLRANRGSLDFREWVANIRGVDLNNQFPADWEREVRRGPKQPAPRGYPGPSPLSEPESRAMADFTRAHDFRLVIEFHSQGEEVYWGYQGYEPEESERIVTVFSEASGYRPVRHLQSWAGYKDWFIQEWRRPGFTVEVGRGVNPLPDLAVLADLEPEPRPHACWFGLVIRKVEKADALRRRPVFVYARLVAGLRLVLRPGSRARLLVMMTVTTVHEQMAQRTEQQHGIPEDVLVPPGPQEVSAGQHHRSATNPHDLLRH